ncbi:MAG: hypothetical protein SFW67_28590 [Myxococcaceae bacterium]|nr:hypothetical protein [Myxococcaceae bacterium]
MAGEENFPKRQHYLKFQCSIPISATKKWVEAQNRVIEAAVLHLKNLAGGAAKNVQFVVLYQDRDRNQYGFQFRDLLVTCCFDGPLTGAANELAVARIEFEMAKKGQDGSQKIGQIILNSRGDVAEDRPPGDAKPILLS